jgi:ABC-type transport system involved in cytochrome bd biosynthesis fused ATPase/permease subunit
VAGVTGKPYTTPWVRDWLLNHPDEAMEVEHLRLTVCASGSLALFGKSGRGPFSAIIHVVGGQQDGYRGNGPTVVWAVRSAVRALEAAA